MKAKEIIERYYFNDGIQTERLIAGKTIAYIDFFDVTAYCGIHKNNKIQIMAIGNDKADATRKLEVEIERQEPEIKRVMWDKPIEESSKKFNAEVDFQQLMNHK